MRRITALLGGAAVVVTAGLSAAAPAMAATSHPAAAHAVARYNPGDGWFAQLYTGTTSLTNKGSGNQAEWSGPSQTVWNTTPATTGYKIMPNGNSSLCLEADSTTLNTEPCASGRNTQWWTFSGGAVCSGNLANIQNVGTGGYIGGFNPSETKPAYVEPMHNTYYAGINICSGA